MIVNNHRLGGVDFPLRVPWKILLYGLDEGILACIDAANGELKWNEAALKDLIGAAVGLNLKGKSQPKTRRASSKRAD